MAASKPLAAKGAAQPVSREVVTVKVERGCSSGIEKGALTLADVPPENWTKSSLRISLR
jgi:hypothetical protein